MAEKVKCKYCEKEYTVGRIEKHEASCDKNPDVKNKEAESNADVVVEESVIMVDKKDTVQKEDKDEIIERQAEEISTLKNQFSKLEGMLEILTKQSGLQSQPSQVVVNNEEEYVEVICNSFEDKVIVLDKNREITLKANRVSTLTAEDVRKISQNRKLSKYLEKGIFQFEDEKWYKKFRIEKVRPLSDDGLAEILAYDREKLFLELDTITEYKKSFSMYNTILFRICRMIKEAKYPEIMANYANFDEYFEGKLGYAMAMAEAFK